MFLVAISCFELFLFVFQLFIPVWLVLGTFIMSRIITEHIEQFLGDFQLKGFDP
jgi:hypothetical protein